MLHESQVGPAVTLSGTITPATVRKVTRLFADTDGPLTITICSFGGDLDAAMAMHELMRLRTSAGGVVMTIGVGAVMSAAVLLLAAGSKGHRVMTRYTRLLYHESSTEVSGPVSRIRSELGALEATDNDFDALIAEYTGKSLKRVQELYAKGDRWLSAAQALKFGFVDRVI